MDSSGPLYPYIGFSLTTSNGTVHRDQIHVSTDQFSAARNTLNVTMGKNWVHGDLKTIKLHVISSKGFGADLHSWFSSSWTWALYLGCKLESSQTPY
ncbi:MAG TPA: hypothetical protein VH500_13630 [Nitrososphaeraceae archaeon]|jgi:hypothetical protein